MESKCGKINGSGGSAVVMALCAVFVKREQRISVK
jgi:hypothetical protein